MKFTLLMPTLNEEEGLKLICPRIKNNWVDQVLLVDGGSEDKTIEIAESYGYEIYKQKEKGLNAAYRECWSKIIGDYVITFSPDNNSIPELIPELIKHIKKTKDDMTVVSRYLRGAKSHDDGFITRVGNFIFTNSINFFHNGKFTDAMCIFRGYRTNLFYELELDNYKKSYFFYDKFFFTNIGVEVLLSIRALKKKIKISEIAGDEPKRVGGISKLQVIRWGLAYYSQIIIEKFID